MEIKKETKKSEGKRVKDIIIQGIIRQLARLNRPFQVTFFSLLKIVEKKIRT